MAEYADPPDMYCQHIEHRRSAHLSHTLVNARLRIEGKPQMKPPPKGAKCCICQLSKMRMHNVSRGSSEHPVPNRPTCFCSLCTSSRQKARRYTTAPGQSVSIDLAGPFKTPTIGNNIYAFTTNQFLDELDGQLKKKLN